MEPEVTQGSSASDQALYPDTELELTLRDAHSQGVAGLCHLARVLLVQQGVSQGCCLGRAARKGPELTPSMVTSASSEPGPGVLL